MLSLRLRLLLAMATVLIVTGGIAAWLASRAIGQRFESYWINREEAATERRVHLQEHLPEMLGACYSEQAGWGPAAPLVSELGALSDQRIVLLDSDGNIVTDSANSGSANSGSANGGGDGSSGASAANESVALSGLSVRPIPANGQRVGGLAVITPPSSGYSSSDNAYIASVNRALLWALLAAGVVSLVLSAALARRILGPIEALTAAVHRMKRGDLDQRVDVPSDDEIGQLAMAFNEMGASLARTEQLRRNMVTDIAHELRTPLSNIRGYLEALQDGLVSPTRATIDSLYEEAILLNRLVNDLQELALAEARQLRLARQPVALREIVEKAAQAAEHHINGSGIRMTLEIAPDLPEVEVDAERIGQVLRNLLNNAFAYTPPMGEVRIAARRVGGRVQVSVYNSGPGIDAEHLPNLFERFYRADRSRSRSTGGSGLGLAIVKQLVEAHGGEVWVESAPGKGATFYFTIPLRSEQVAV